MGKFEEDLAVLLEKLCVGLNKSEDQELRNLGAKLVRLHSEGLIKINHSVMELVCAKHLIVAGHDVDVESVLDGLSCDIYATKGLGTLIVEVETGFVPPKHALDLLTYCKARITSKITRYSNNADKFALAAPPHYVMWIHKALTKPPRHRTAEEIEEIKTLCDLYYNNPPVRLDEIRNARLHAIYLLNVDAGSVEETDPLSYLRRTKRMVY
jgi:hypothetical protein